MTLQAPAPVTAIGYAQAPNYNWWLYSDETTPELIWPQSVYVFDQMRRTDSQVTSVLRAMTLPVRRTPWRIDPNGARPEVVQFVADDLGLPIVGQKAPKAPPRSKDRFSWAEHLRQALLMLPFGHMYFEQLYRVNKAGTEAHLRKLEPRMPRTIEFIDVATDGGLVSIKQYWTNLQSTPEPIPVNRLVAYIHEKEGGNWLGTSILRPAYKNWLLKDRLLRVQAQTIERNGMGIPLATAPEGVADLAPYLAMAKAWRAGEAAGTALAAGATLKLVGVEGTLPDAEPAIRYHDEQIGRAVLAHFLNLGTQTGSWALGTTFADFFTLSLQTLADQVADTATQHIIEDLVDINFGEDEPAPRMVCDEIGSRQAATAEALAALIDSGVIRPDEVLEESSRQQYGLPPADPKTTRTPPTPGGGQPPIPTDGSATPGDLPPEAPAAAPAADLGGTDASAAVAAMRSVAASAADEIRGLLEEVRAAAGVVRAVPPPDDDDPPTPEGPPEPEPTPPPSPVAADAPELLGEDIDEQADAITAALDEWVEAQLPAEVEAKFNPEELRVPGGHGGGRWTKNPIGKAISDALDAWGKGKGPDDPFTFDGKPIDREPLRKAAVARGITLKRGASREEIVHALLGGVKDEVVKQRAERLKRRGSAKFSIDVGGKVDPEAAREVEVENRIRAVYGDLLAERPANGNRLVNLADLRDRLGEENIRNTEIELALKRMIGEPGVNLIPELNQSALTPRLRSASVHMGGQDKHHISIADPSPRPMPTPVGGKRTDVAVYTDAATGKKAALREVTSANRPGRVITSQDDLAGLEQWATDNGHTDVAQWAAGERARAEAKGAPKKVGKAATKAPSVTPSPEAKEAREILTHASSPYELNMLLEGRSKRQVAGIAEHLGLPVIGTAAQMRVSISQHLMGPDQEQAPGHFHVSRLNDLLTDMAEPPTQLEASHVRGAREGWPDVLAASAARSSTASTAAQEALHDYKSDANFREVNDSLFAGNYQPGGNSIIDGVRGAMAPLAADVIVWRGGSGLHRRLPRGSYSRRDGLEGAEWTRHDFASTSASEQAALDFATKDDGSDRGSQPTLMRIRVPAGTPAVAIDSVLDRSGPHDISRYLDEQELLLGDGLTYRITHDYGVVRGTRRLDVEVVPPKAATKPGAVVAPGTVSELPTHQSAVAPPSAMALFRRASGSPMTYHANNALKGADVALKKGEAPADVAASLREQAAVLKREPLAEDGIMERIGRTAAERRDLRNVEAAQLVDVADQLDRQGLAGAPKVPVKKTAAKAVKAAPSGVPKVAAKRVPKVAEAIPPASEVKAHLQGLPTHQGADAEQHARDYIDGLGLSGPQLKQLAGELEVPLVGRTKPAMRDDIVKVLVGGRVMTAAVDRGVPFGAPHPDGLDAYEGTRLKSYAAEFLDSTSGMSDPEIRAALRAQGVGSPDVEREKRIAEEAAAVKADPYIEVLTSYKGLSVEESVRGRNLTPAGRAALDALGPAGHPRIAAIPTAEGKIRGAYAMLAMPDNATSGDSWVGLEDLRKLIGDQMPRSEIDAELHRMATLEHDDVRMAPQAYARYAGTKERLAAAIMVGGQERNLIHIDGRQQLPPPPRPLPEPAGGARPKGEGVKTGAAALAAAPVGMSGAEHPTFRGLESLTPAKRKLTREALLEYQHADFEPINDVLRNGPGKHKPGDVKRYEAQAARLSAAVDSSPLASDVETWRGLGGSQVIFGPSRDWPADLTGRTWTDGGFVSTSTERNSAGDFAGDVLMRLTVPSGTPAVQMSGADHESELLLGTGHTFRVVADHGPTEVPTGKGRTHKVKRLLDVEIVPAGAASAPAPPGTTRVADPAGTPGLLRVLPESQRGRNGDGSYRNPDGTRGPWGQYGASGLLLRHVGEDGEPRYLLAKRSPSVENGGTWAFPGGAKDEKETDYEGATRELVEELGLSASDLAAGRVHGTHTATTPGGWHYTSIAATVPTQVTPKLSAGHWETTETRWMAAGEIADLDRQGLLHPAVAGGKLDENVLGLFPPAVARPKTGAGSAATPANGDAARGGSALRATAVNPTGTQLAAVDRYGGDGAYVINNDLRAVAGRVEDLEPRNRATVEALDALMQDSPLAQDIEVHRVVALTKNPFSESTTGEVDRLDRDLTDFSWTEPGYSSTSAVARRPGYNAISMRIAVPAGTPAISYKTLDNGEILLPHGLTFRVAADHGKDEQQIRQLDVEIIPSDAPSAIRSSAPGGPHHYRHGWIPVDPLAEAAQAKVAERVARWHTNLGDLHDQVHAVASGAHRVGPLAYGHHERSRSDLAEFGDHSEGVVTTYLGDATRHADADQLGSVLARSMGIPAPRRLRVGGDRTVAEITDGSTWSEREGQITDDVRAYELEGETPGEHIPRVQGNQNAYQNRPPSGAALARQRDDLARQRGDMLNSDAAKRAGVFDLLAGIDDRDGGTVVLGRDGLVPVQNEGGWLYADGRNRTAEVAGGRLSKANGAVAPAERRDAELTLWSAFSSLRSWKDNPLTPADVAWLRERLDAVRPDFEKLGRQRWWQFASDRLDALAAHAKGTTNLFPDPGGQ